MSKLKVNIETLGCKSCEITIEQIILEMPGVQAVKASAKKKQVIIDFDEKIIQKEQIIEAITEAGHEIF
ncbi:MAG: cation transporter [Erysipelotrichales bacterium]|nr:cation transporter [Erysipelotrichales bacterium]